MTMRVYYSLAVWRFKPILGAGLRFHSYLSGGLRLRDYRAVAGNQKFSSRFSVFACFCGGYSNRIKRLRRLSGNFILLKASLFNEGFLFRARPSQSELPVPLCPRPTMWAGGGELIWYKARLQSFKRVTKARGKMANDVVNVDIIKCVTLFYKAWGSTKGNYP